MEKYAVSALFMLALLGALYAAFKLFQETPDDDRTYNDKPPLLYRIFWPVILLIAATISPVFSKTTSDTYQVLLRRAGQDYSLTPIQFYAGKVLCVVLGFFFGLLLTKSLGSVHIGGSILLAFLAYYYPNLWLKEANGRRNTLILKALPFYIDLLTLSVEAGLNLSGSMRAAAERSRPGPLVVEINRVLREVGGGRPRVEALRDFSDRLKFSPISSFVSALIQGEKTGSSLGPILRAQGDQRRTERFLRAEKLAMEAPVKMLGPLILCIFPCTFIVIGFPIAMKFMKSGIF
jgi:tight adherence protein C